MGFSYTFSDNFHVKTNSKNYRVVSFSGTVIYFVIDITNWVIFIRPNYWSLGATATRTTERSYCKTMLIYIIRIFLAFIHCLISCPSYKCTRMK